MKINKEEMQMLITLYVMLVHKQLTKKQRPKAIFCLLGLYTSNTVVPYNADEFDTYLTATDARRFASFTPEPMTTA